MDETAEGIMLTDFQFVDCNATVAEAEERFQQTDLLALPVLNPDRTVFGLLTVQHLAAFHRKPANRPLACLCWEICAPRPLLASPADSLHDTTTALLTAQTEYAMIVNDDRQLIGIITAAMLLERGFSLLNEAG